MFGKLQQRPGKYMLGKFQYMHGKLQYMTGKLQQMPGKLHNMPGKLLYIISQESYSICTPGKDTEYIYAWKSYSTYTVCLESGIPANHEYVPGKVHTWDWCTYCIYACLERGRKTDFSLKTNLEKTIQYSYIHVKSTNPLKVR